MQSYKKILLVTIVLVTGVVITITALHGQSKKDSTILQQEEATPITEGVMTEKQKVHSKLYKNYSGVGKKLRDISSHSPNGEDIKIEALPSLPELSPARSSQTSALEEIASSADAIVIGVVRDKSSQLTENGMFIFTDYQMVVEDVLKSNGAIKRNEAIMVTRPGGKILLNGHVITAVDRSVKPLGVGGRYLLFLKFIPSTGAYQPASNYGSFQISDGKAVALTEDPLTPSELRNNQDASSLINIIRAACRQ